MPLLSDSNAFDRQAGQRAQTALDSWHANQGHGFTVEEVCERADYPVPVSEADLMKFAGFCEQWNIHTNLDDVPYFKTARARDRAASTAERS